jgi:hypothetical protein
VLREEAQQFDAGVTRSANDADFDRHMNTRPGE